MIHDELFRTICLWIVMNRNGNRIFSKWCKFPRAYRSFDITIVTWFVGSDVTALQNFQVESSFKTVFIHWIANLRIQNFERLLPAAFLWLAVKFFLLKKLLIWRIFWSKNSSVTKFAWIALKVQTLNFKAYVSSPDLVWKAKGSSGGESKLQEPEILWINTEKCTFVEDKRCLYKHWKWA